MTTPVPGTVTWIDLTVPNADAVRAFYEEVAGWASESVTMQDYNDFCMLPAAGAAPVAGICHSRGVNAGLPPQWLIYINVRNLNDSLEAVVRNGGEILERRPASSWGTMAVIRDPAGAVCALFQPVE